MARISFNHVYKRYGKNQEAAVKDFNLEVHDKEFLVFVGPSGCGKSTSLRMLAGLEDVSEGEIRIGEERINEFPPRDRNISMVFQNYALYPNMTVYENMAFGLRLRRMAKHEIDLNVKQAARTLEIESYLDRKPRELSGGQRQRVALGRAIVRIPDVFLMDEPLSNLDARLRVQMRSEIIQLHKKIGVTTIYVTHDQIEAMTMGDRIVVMDKGVIQQVDTPYQVYFKPKNRFVAGFIGSPPINFIDGRIEEEGIEGEASLKFHTSRFTLSIPGKQARSLRSLVGVGRTVVLGIRPEHIRYGQEERIGQEASEGAAFSPVRGEQVCSEFIGSDQYGHVEILSRKRIVLRSNPFQRFNNGERVTVYFDMSKALFFHAGTGELLDD